MTRDPRTHQEYADREGLPGHHGLSRDEVLFIRLMHHLKQRIELVALKEGRSVNDVVNDALAEKFLGPLPQEVAVPVVEPIPAEVAYESFDGPIKDTYPKDQIMAELTREPILDISQLDAIEDRGLPAMYQFRLDRAEDRCTRYEGDGVYQRKQRVGFNDARMAEETAILKAQRLREEKAREEFRRKRVGLFKAFAAVEKLQRQPGNPQRHRQYYRGSHWDTDGGATRAEVYEASQSLRKPPKD